MKNGETEREHNHLFKIKYKRAIYKIKVDEKNIQNKRYICKQKIIQAMLCNRITLYNYILYL